MNRKPNESLGIRKTNLRVRQDELGTEAKKVVGVPLAESLTFVFSGTQRGETVITQSRVFHLFWKATFGVH